MQATFACSFVVSIQRSGATGQVLLATADPRPDNWIQAPGTTATPARIAATIRAALAGGWNPGENGSAFYCTLAGSEQ